MGRPFITTASKICIGCGIEMHRKPSEDIAAWNTKRRFHSDDCYHVWRSEHSTHSQLRSHATPEQQRAYRLNNPDKNRAYEDRHTVKRYGLSLNEFRRLYAMQEGKCAICRQPEGKRRLGIDHCHVSNNVRGLLCCNCNSVLGYAKDDVEVLRRAIDYLTLNQLDVAV